MSDMISELWRKQKAELEAGVYTDEERKRRQNELDHLQEVLLLLLRKEERLALQEERLAASEAGAI